MMSVLLIYTGGNIGEGPSFWNNIFCGVLGIGTFLVLWLCLELGGAVAQSVAEERDVATGLRAGSFAVAQGLILGRALAGDWHSMLATIEDFARAGWPAAALTVLAIVCERLLRPGPRCPFPSWKTRGLPIAALYLAIAFIWLFYLGSWEGT